MQQLPAPLCDYITEPVPAACGSLAAAAVARAQEMSQDGTPLGLALAAAFDLVVAAKYYSFVQPENWLWCQHSGLDAYPFLNACPLCIFEERYVHHEGNKPPSGHIGPVTAEALREILVEYFHLTNRSNLSVRRGREPVDIAIVDFDSKHVLVAEIKASPLFTPPLAVGHAAKGFAPTTTKPLKHTVGTMRGLQDAEPSLVIPGDEGGYWLWPLGLQGLGAAGWAERALAAALQRDPQQFRAYVGAWRLLWHLYLQKDGSQPAFWLTGACGLPGRPGEGWPQSSDGRPTGSISDSKTSVGMDRTDDIKKSTFQVLNLGVRLRREPIGPWSLRIGLMSNLHAGRHHEKYLSPYEDIMWGWAQDDGGGPEDLFRLFDGIISFSRSHTKDRWIEGVIDWH